MNDIELTEALQKLYPSEGITSAEREKGYVPGYVPSLKWELYEVSSDLGAHIGYEERVMLLVRERSDTTARIPFDSIPELTRFLNWLAANKDIGSK